MRRMILKVVVGVAITATVMFGADNSIGTWKRNVAQSKVNAASKNPIKSETMVNEAIEGGVKTTVTGERRDGTPIHISASLKYDGKDYPVIGANWETASGRQVDANTFNFEYKKSDGKYHVTGHTVISKDGKTMTETLKGTNSEGKPIDIVQVYDRQ